MNDGKPLSTMTFPARVDLSVGDSIVVNYSVRLDTLPNGDEHATILSEKWRIKRTPWNRVRKLFRRVLR